MGLFIMFLIGFFAVLYLVSRLNTLEQKVRRLEKNGISMSVPAPPIDVARLSEKAPLPPQERRMAPAVGGIAPQVLSGPIGGHDKTLEFKFGSRFFTVIGAVAVILGVGFFLRYAFEQNLITETMRLVLGLVAALALLTVGEYLRKKYESYGEVLQGTGMAVLYLTVFAAFSFYGIFSQTAALFGMIIVTLVGVLLAIRANSWPLAAVAQFGAYVTPFLISLPASDPNQLMVYIFVVNIGALLLAVWKSWRRVTLGALLGTAILYVSWHAEYYQNSLMLTSMVYLTLFYLTFLSANIYRYFILKHKADENDLALVLFNPLFYFLAGYAVMDPINSDYPGIFAFALGILYFVLGVIIPRDNEDSKIFHFGVSSILLFAAVPILFEAEWVSVAWAAEAMFFMYYGLFRNWKNLQYVAHTLFMVSVLRFSLCGFPGC